MLRPNFRTAVLFILALTVGSAAPGFAKSKDFNHSYPLLPGGSFELQNVNGPVQVEGWDRDVIEIHAVKIAKENRGRRQAERCFRRHALPAK